MTIPAAGSARPLAAHVWAKEKDGFYCEPPWCSERLFEVESFAGDIWDPACGIGRIADAARRAGHRPIIATDIIDRGYAHFDGTIDFLSEDLSPVTNIVTNPPFQVCNAFVRRALEAATDKVAMIWLVRRLNAARWLRATPLARIYFLTPRPSMPPAQVILAGEKPGGGTQDFCWLIFSHGHEGPPEVRWLHRDGEQP